MPPDCYLRRGLSPRLCVIITIVVRLITKDCIPMIFLQSFYHKLMFGLQSALAIPSRSVQFLHKKIWIWCKKFRFNVKHRNFMLETVTKKMTLAFWAVERFLVIFDQICINYTKSNWFSALKWGTVRFCTYLETKDTGKSVKKCFFQFHHFC